MRCVVFVLAVKTWTEKNWPSQGKIEFKHVSLSYDINQEPVVKDISFTINAGEKVSLKVNFKYVFLLALFKEQIEQFHKIWKVTVAAILWPSYVDKEEGMTSFHWTQL